MTKKLAITYTFLFLFVFTFALSFTLASQAQAQPTCCVYQWCYLTNPPYVGVMGHTDKGVCVYTGAPPCDTAYICGDS